MTKKELIKRIEEYKPKYIYQRYNGRIMKYEVVNDNYLVNVETGMSINFKKHVLLGKLSENILDLLECDDVVKVFDNGGRYAQKIEIYDKRMLEEIKKEIVQCGYELSQIYTKEQMESISYKVKE